MTSNTLTDLRGMLFDTLRDLRDPNKTPDLERAKAVNSIAQTLINSARVEIDYLQINQQADTGFIAAVAGPSEAKTKAGETVEQLPGGRRVTHRMVG